MYPEFASKFWANLKLAYNLCDENQNIRVHDMRNYMKEKSQLGCQFYNIFQIFSVFDNLLQLNMNYVIDTSDYGSNTSKKASDSENPESGNDTISEKHSDLSVFRSEVEVRAALTKPI